MAELDIQRLQRHVRRRYEIQRGVWALLGSIRGSGAGFTEDSESNPFVWNLNNWVWNRPIRTSSD